MLHCSCPQKEYECKAEIVASCVFVDSRFVERRFFLSADARARLL